MCQNKKKILKQVEKIERVKLRVAPDSAESNTSVVGDSAESNTSVVWDSAESNTSVVWDSAFLWSECQMPANPVQFAIKAWYNECAEETYESSEQYLIFCFKAEVIWL